MSSIKISAAAFAGTPNTDAGPDMKVVIPIFSSAGFSWANADPDANASAPAIFSSFSIFIYVSWWFMGNPDETSGRSQSA